jgi:hypothetical protein
MLFLILYKNTKNPEPLPRLLVLYVNPRHFFEDGIALVDAALSGFQIPCGKNELASSVSGGSLFPRGLRFDKFVKSGHYQMILVLLAAFQVVIYFLRDDFFYIFPSGFNQHFRLSVGFGIIEICQAFKYVEQIHMGQFRFKNL